MVRQLGGELVDATGKPQFDSASVIRTMQFFHDVRMKYKANDPAFPSADLSVDMARGRVAMWIAGIWAIANIVKTNPKMKGEIGVAPLPTWTRGGKRVTCKYAWAWYVNPRSAPEKQREGSSRCSESSAMTSSTRATSSVARTTSSSRRCSTAPSSASRAVATRPAS
jgi:ABC-type glycerol-3-phosphate transport system substrate-binding protein